MRKAHTRFQIQARRLAMSHSMTRVRLRTVITPHISQSSLDLAYGIPWTRLSYCSKLLKLMGDQVPLKGTRGRPRPLRTPLVRTSWTNMFLSGGAC